MMESKKSTTASKGDSKRSGDKGESDSSTVASTSSEGESRKSDRGRSHKAEKKREKDHASHGDTKLGGKKKGHHHDHDKDAHSVASEASKDKGEDSTVHSTSDNRLPPKQPELHRETNPDYHWENHGESTPKTTRRHTFHTCPVRGISLLSDDDLEDGVFDIALDEDTEAPDLVSAHDVPTLVVANLSAPQNIATDGGEDDDDDLSEQQAKEEEEDKEKRFFKAKEEDEEDEEDMDMAQDQALQTAPLSPVRVRRTVPMAGSPRGVISRPNPGLPVRCSLSPRIAAATESPMSGLHRHSLGGPLYGGHPHPSFIPPFLADMGDDEEGEESEDVGSDRYRRSDKEDSHNLGHGSISTSSNEWEWPDGRVVPEAMGRDEAIPEINERLYPSLL